MKIILSKSICILLMFLYKMETSNAQAPFSTDTVNYKIISAGPEYKKSSFYQWLWGSNYRKEWIQPIAFPVLILDTLKGGLISYKEGGSHQSSSLHLKTAGNKQYALRSINKSLAKVIPEIFHHTFIADIVDDEISMSHPYGALGVPLMAEAVHVNHSVPQYFYLPEQAALDTLNKKYANNLYLLEQRPVGDWSNFDALGNFKEFTDSDKMLEKIFEDNDHAVDQLAFARARLFDMLLADFDRHQDQWKWGIKKEGDKTFYEPVPTDRDQAFFKHNGILLNAAISASGMKFFQNYDYTIQNVKSYAFVNRIMDRLLTNKMTLAQWQSIATDMQQLLTDNIIEASIKQMPPEVFAIDGNDIIAKMKSRRNHLVEYATEYYLLLAQEAEIVGTKESEYFEITHLANDEVIVNIYKNGQAGSKKDEPFYSRSFKTEETKEIRMYGLAGNDIYKITGKANDKIKIRIIGGKDRDSIINRSVAYGKNRLQVYDDAANSFKIADNTSLHISSDTAVHEYNYNSFKPDKKGLGPHIGYNDDDRIFLGLRYTLIEHKWRKLPFAAKHTLDVDYSVIQNAMSATYNGLYPKLIGKWDLVAKANYDQVRWINFFGLGNETIKATNNMDYYRMRTEEALGSAGISRNFGKNNIRISGFYQRVKIINDSSRFIAKAVSSSMPDVFKPNDYAGLQIAYNLADVNDSILPEKGVTFSINAKHTQNFQGAEKSFQKYSGILQLFIPLIPKFSLAIKTGASTINGTPEFYQYPSIGETYNLRGYRRERFSGQTSFYNNTELRFITKVRSYIFNGKGGLLAFIDNGRVWMPGETSNSFHSAYGGGAF